MAERIKVTVNGTVYTVEIDDPGRLDGGPIEVRVNGQPYTVQLGAPARPQAAPAPAGSPEAPAATPPTAEGPVAAAPVSTGQAQRVTAPMPGKILSVSAQVGDQVQAHATLCTLEAMKMEMAIAAPAAGIIREVQAQVGANVGYGDLLFVLE